MTPQKPGYKLFFLLVFILTAVSAQSQTFYRSWGTASTFDAGEAVTKFGNDIIVGGTKNDSAFIMRVTAMGEPVWIRRFKLFAGSPRTYVNFLSTTSDQFIIGTGYNLVGSGASEGFYFKLDGNGNMIFLKSNNQHMYFKSINEKNATQYFVIGGYNAAGGSTSTDIKVLTVNQSNGNIVAQSSRMDIASPGTNWTDDVEGTAVVNSDRFYTTGRFSVVSPGTVQYMRPYLNRHSGNGSIVWSKYLHKSTSGTVRCYPQAIVYKAPNRLYIPYSSDETCTGACDNFFPGLMITDTLGNVLVDRTYDLPASSGELVRGLVTDGENFYLIGYTNHTSPSAGIRDAFIIKVDENGDLVKANRFGAGAINENFMVSFISPAYCDSSFIYLTGSKNTGTANSDIFLMKIDTALNIACGATPVTCNIQNVTPFSASTTINYIANTMSVSNAASALSYTIPSTMPCTVSNLYDTIPVGTAPLTLDATTTGGSGYTWNNGTTGTSITVTLPGTYTCVISVGCCSYIHTFVVVGCTPPTLEISHDNPVCPGDTLHLFYTGAQTYVTSYNEIFYSEDSLVLGLSAGTHIFEVDLTDSIGCLSDTTFTITIAALDSITFADPPVFCPGAPVNLLATGDYDFVWDNGSATYTGNSIVVPAVSTMLFEVTATSPLGCVVDTSYLLEVDTCSFTTQYDTVYLTGTTAVLDAWAAGAIAYNWTTGETSTTYNTTTPGVYICLVSFTCCNYWQVFTVNTCTVSPINISIDTAHCFGETTSITLGGIHDSYTWDDGIITFTGNTHTITIPSVYTFDIFGLDSNGCRTDTTFSLTIELQDTITFVPPNAHCFGDTVTFGFIGDYNFTWTEGTDTWTGPFVTVPANRSYHFIMTAVDEHGCTMTGPYDLIVTPPTPPEIIYYPDNTPCLNDFMTISISGASNCTWFDGMSMSFGNSISLSPNGLVNYTVTGTDENGCEILDTFITIDPLPLPNAFFGTDTVFDPCVGYTYSFSAHDGAADAYYWNINDEEFPGGPGISFTPGYGSVFVQMTAEKNGCKDSALQYIFNDTTGLIHPQLLIPNVFTPNGDGTNDYFKVTIVPVDHFSISIFDRWGLLVYQSDSPDFKWDGMYKNSILADGNYLYVIHFTNPCKNEGAQQVNGWVNISR